MSFAETTLLAAVAGATIFAGLPIARIESLGSRTRVALAMLSVGILAFLFVDVLAHGFEIAEHAMEEYEEGEGGFAEAAGLALLLVGGFGLGCAGLGFLERRLRRSGAPKPIGGAAADAMTVGDAHVLRAQGAVARDQVLRTGLFVAAAIGLHNFGEGLAVGVSAGSGEIALATVLIVGFALHNATEGFGIIGPLGGVRPSWGWLGLSGLIAGAPVVLGAMIGYNVTSEALELGFYALAGGAILYVIGEIWHAAGRAGHRELGLLMIAVGFAAGVLTDLVVVLGGGS